ncbi:hypothetical protein [Thermosediminibacter oceani]|uniref:Uncharacterized protein n=1 Tax=Thermosediminibacter oceani (strain ATCC BAA-1034 / DSM 16646 / JW/IW-1228P) TaxID=555079 RepID=D9RXW8_THEOJ|nr:hypothetical protein [Thermosediminibacter oceani]ADL08192.1 hypothetical protein Toce_1439 [Thermosediminibacter oceani DSM 16646]
MAIQNKDTGKKEKGRVKEEIAPELAVRKEDLNRIRGLRKVVDPERGPENKKSPHS